MVGPEPPSAAASGRPHRSLATAYLIWFLLGIFGAHRFYLGDARAGRRFLIALGVGVALPVIGLLLALATRSFEGVSLGLDRLVGWPAGPPLRAPGCHPRRLPAAGDDAARE